LSIFPWFRLRLTVGKGRSLHFGKFNAPLRLISAELVLSGAEASKDRPTFNPIVYYSNICSVFPTLQIDPINL